MFFLFLMGYFTSIAQQEALTYESTDSITYRQYRERDFKGLRRTGLQAIEQDIDFYYLRMRLGISYYESSNYEAALEHFKRAYSMNPTDDVVQEYYYYSLLFTNRKEDALDIAEAGGERLQRLCGYPQQNRSRFARSFETIALTGGITLTDPSADAATKDYKSGGVYAESAVQGAMSLTSVYIANAPTTRWKIKNYFTIFSISSVGIVQSTIPTVAREYSNTGFQHNIMTDYIFKNGFQAGVAAGLYKERSTRLTARFEGSNITPVIYDYLYDNIAFTTSLYSGYRISNVHVSLSASFGNLAKKSQSQVESGITYYPFGNQNYYATAYVAVLHNDTMTNPIVSIKLGAKLLPTVWCEAKGGYGNHHNYIGAFGVEAYNTVDPIMAHAGIGLIFGWKSMTLRPNYTLQQRESSTLRYSTATAASSTVTTRYYNQLFTTTLTWNL